MSSKADEREREIRFEYLRPAQLNGEMERCPLVFLPIGPLEYHGPHLPVGTDPINATECALEACRRFGRGVVHPTLFWGTERERPASTLGNLGFDEDDWVVGMDFPTATWRSHYYGEEIFGLVLSSTLDMLISRGYRAIVITNGHGARNHMQTIDRLALHFSHTTDALVVWELALVVQPQEQEMRGHADLFETSLMLHYEQERVAGVKLVDTTALPPREKAIGYRDYSIVDGPGFRGEPHPDKIVVADPRDANVALGERIFEDSVSAYMELAKEALSRTT